MNLIESRHTLAWCGMCGDMVLCAVCGNNCCNGGYGEIDGQKCSDCPEAYEHQAAFWKDQSAVKFAKDTRDGRSGTPTPEEGRAFIQGFFKPAE